MEDLLNEMRDRESDGENDIKCTPFQGDDHNIQKYKVTQTNYR